jgi:hypothetical protein
MWIDKFRLGKKERHPETVMQQIGSDHDDRLYFIYADRIGITQGSRSLSVYMYILSSSFWFLRLQNEENTWHGARSYTSNLMRWWWHDAGEGISKRGGGGRVTANMGSRGARQL